MKAATLEGIPLLPQPTEQGTRPHSTFSLALGHRGPRPRPARAVWAGANEPGPSLRLCHPAGAGSRHPLGGPGGSGGRGDRLTQPASRRPRAASPARPPLPRRPRSERGVRARAPGTDWLEPRRAGRRVRTQGLLVPPSSGSSSHPNPPTRLARCIIRGPAVVGRLGAALSPQPRAPAGRSRLCWPAPHLLPAPSPGTPQRAGSQNPRGITGRPRPSA